ncbi:MAG: hypothetical protein FWG85_02365 [Bacteroidetes bacterium]|nr:hypothetical protein [Bacteroidota bacterium]
MNNYIEVFKKVLIICLMFLVSASLYSATFSGGNGTIANPYLISSVPDMEELADSVNSGITSFAGEQFIVTANIGVVTQMIGDDVNYFAGYFNGGGRKITVNINSDAANVGLFSKIDNGGISSLIVDGSVTGGPASQNVGGFVGQVLLCGFHDCTNLADVTGESATSSVGGLVGTANFAISGYIADCYNNGTITGGQYVAGIAGKIIMNNSYLTLKYSMNAGTIQGNNTTSEMPTYIGGIVGYVKDPTDIYCNVNIGIILSNDFNYAGGIVGQIETFGASEYFGYFVSSNSNSGIVDGAIDYVGGIAGYVGNDVIVDRSINTNWVDSGTAQYFGAIVGENNGLVEHCYNDEQMCILDVIGVNNGSANSVSSLPTEKMLGTNLPIAPLDTPPQLYPIIGAFSPGFCHPILLLSVAPIYLQDNPLTGVPERLDYVTAPFYVSNGWAYPPPNYIPYNFPYQWGWFNQGYIPFSANGFIEIVPLNNANIIVHGGGQDSLSVQLEYNWLINTNYNGFYSGNYNIIFEKIVPIYVGI